MTWSKSFRRFIGVANRVIVLVVIAAALTPKAPGQSEAGAPIMSREQARAIIQDLYAQQDDAWSRHDVGRIVSFVDPGYVFLEPGGKQTAFVEWRRNFPAFFQSVRNSHVKTTIKDVQVQGGTLVASIQWEHKYEVKNGNPAVWVSRILSAEQEETWKKAGPAWKIVLTKTISQDVFEPVALSAMVNDDTELIAFLCGGPLSAEEKQRIASFAAVEFPKNPNAWYRNDSRIRHDLQDARKYPGPVSGEIWERWRLNFALSAPGDVEAQIVEAHDPTVVFDRENKLLVTLQAVRSLRDAVGLWAHQSGESIDPQYVTRMSELIRREYMKWTVDQRSKYAHIVSNFPAAVVYIFGIMKPQGREKFWAGWRPTNAGSPENTTKIAYMASGLSMLLLQVKMQQSLITQDFINKMGNYNLCQQNRGFRIMDGRSSWDVGYCWFGGPSVP